MPSNAREQTNSMVVPFEDTSQKDAPARLNQRSSVAEFWKALLDRPFRVDIGIDLGTANTLVFLRDHGIIMNEPSVVAVTRGSHTVLNEGGAVGFEAKKMLGKTSYSVDVIRPLREGVISNFPITEAMLRYFISRVKSRRMFSQTRVVIAIPFGITHAEMKAVYNSTIRSGADKVHLIEETLAAGLGAGLRIDDPTANLVVDIGGGTTGISVISVADIAFGTTVRCAGDHMTDAVHNFIRERYKLQIGLQTAEQLKIELGSALPDKDGEGEETRMIRGQNDEGRPATVEVSSADVREALAVPLRKILRGIDWVLENTPPELAADLVDRGILMTGGGALLPRLDQLISDHTGLNVTVADDPLGCVARGAGAYLETVDWQRNQ